MPLSSYTCLYRKGHNVGPKTTGADQLHAPGDVGVDELDTPAQVDEYCRQKVRPVLGSWVGVRRRFHQYVTLQFLSFSKAEHMFDLLKASGAAGCDESLELFELEDYLNTLDGSRAPPGGR